MLVFSMKEIVMTQQDHVPAAERVTAVTGALGEQATRMASETGAQARNLLAEGMDQLRGQARDGQQRLVGGLRQVASQLRQMSDRAEGSGMASDLVRQATDRADQAASWLEAREPGQMLDELRGFARRRPAMFLAGATVAGMLVGRLTRNVVASAQNEKQDGEAPAVAADSVTTTGEQAVPVRP